MIVPSCARFEGKSDTTIVKDTGMEWRLLSQFEVGGNLRVHGQLVEDFKVWFFSAEGIPEMARQFGFPFQQLHGQNTKEVAAKPEVKALLLGDAFGGAPHVSLGTKTFMGHAASKKKKK